MDFLIAAAGTIVGVSLSPEVWIAGIVTGLLVSRLWLVFVIALVVSVCVQLLVDASARSVGFSNSSGHFVIIVLARTIAILIFAFAACAIKAIILRRLPAKLPTSTQG